MVLKIKQKGGAIGVICFALYNFDKRLDRSTTKLGSIDNSGNNFIAKKDKNKKFIEKFFSEYTNINILEKNWYLSLIYYLSKLAMFALFFSLYNLLKQSNSFRNFFSFFGNNFFKFCSLI